MKQIYLLFALLTMVVFSSCEGPIGPAGRDGFDGLDGRDGSDGVNTLSQVIEIQTSFDANNGYEQLYTFPQSVQVFESDLILVYLLFEQTTDNQGNAIDVWRLMPQTRILDQGLLQYNYDHTFIDVRLFLESDFDANNVLIIKGENGVNDIEEHIAKHGGDVESISVYRRNVFEEYTQIRNDYLKANAIIFTSTMAVKIYFEKIYHHTVDTKFYSISNRIRSKIEEYGLEAITLDYFSDNLLEKIKST